MDPLVRNNVIVAGVPDAARTIVFVNGLGTDQTCWNKVAPFFADGYRLVRFDHVGSIESNQAYFRAHQVDYLNVAGYATDLLEICSALALDGDTVLVGHSLGAMAGLLACVERPGQFSRLVLLGASPCYVNSEGYPGGFSEEDIDATYAALARNYADWSKQLALAALDSPASSSLVDQFMNSLARIPKDMMLTIMCSLLQADHRADLPRVGVPTLLLQTRRDYFVPLAVAEYLQAQIPDCRLEMIDATGHLPHVSAPEAVVAAIGRFIR